MLEPSAQVQYIVLKAISCHPVSARAEDHLARHNEGLFWPQHPRPAAGRVVFELFVDVAPEAAERFRCLCTGRNGAAYRGNTFYRSVLGQERRAGIVAGDQGDRADSSTDAYRPEYAGLGTLFMASAFIIRTGRRTQRWKICCFPKVSQRQWCPRPRAR